MSHQAHSFWGALQGFGVFAGFWGALQQFGEFGNVGSFTQSREVYQCTKRSHQPQGWVGLPAWTPHIPPHRFTRRLLGCCFAAPQLNLVGNRGSGGRWDPGCVLSHRRSPALGSRPEWEQRDLCAPAAPEPALQAGTTVPLVTAEHGPLGDGSVPCHGPRDARRQAVLETPLCLWCRVEDAGGALGRAERVF